jgi:hypothetical protein
MQAPKGAAEIDLTEIRAAMADAVKEAEANDPKLLRAKIRELEKQSARPQVQEKIVEVPVLKDAQIERAGEAGRAAARTRRQVPVRVAELRRLIAPAADLFSGIGGFSLGLERAGMRTVAFCEIDPYCRAVLRKHWPDVPCFERCA